MLPKVRLSHRAPETHLWARSDFMSTSENRLGHRVGAEQTPLQHPKAPGTCAGCEWRQGVSTRVLAGHGTSSR